MHVYGYHVYRDNDNIRCSLVEGSLLAPWLSYVHTYKEENKGPMGSALLPHAYYYQRSH